MTYRILLVDDESIDLEWLKRRVSDSMDRLTIVGAETSAFAAAALLEERHVDIMLTDIRMPIMSGLELAAKARQLQPHIKIVFVSGHEDFEYAKQAIKVNAAAYLLKPVDDGELRETLLGLMRQLGEERRLAETGKQWQKALPLIEKELVLSWLEGTASPQAEQVAEQALQLLGPELLLTVALIEIDDWEWKWSPLSDAHRESMLEGIFREAADVCASRNAGTCFRDKHHRLILLSGSDRSELLTCANDVVAAVRARFPATVTVGVGSRVPRGPELQASYRQAKQALKDKLFLGKDRVIAGAVVKSQAGAAVADPGVISEAIFQDMLHYRLVSVDDRLEELFRQAEPFEEKATIVHYVVQFISRLHVHCQQWNENLYELLNWEYVHLNVMFQFETIHDMKSWLRRRLFELSELLYIKNQKQNRKIIHAILEYVDSQLAAKVTLKQVASHFDFSPNYLGQLFKEETGEHFSDYLIRVRVDRACELLLDPRLKVYEIADRMGYKNILYFNRQFKQLTGMTPGDYRKRHKV